MHRSMFAALALVVPTLVILCLACSSGNGGRTKSSPPPAGRAGSFEDVLLQLGRDKCRLRETTTGKWILEFEKGRLPRTFQVLQVGVDYVRLREDKIVLNIPFSSIALVTSED